MWGMTDALTGDDGVDRPAAIESVTPVENAVQVLQQEGVVVDFEYGYEGKLFIDGVELPITMLGQIEVAPGEMIELPPTAVFDPGNAVLSFQPVEGALIESFTEGRHEAKVIFWKTDRGRRHRPHATAGRSTSSDVRPAPALRARRRRSRRRALLRR